MSELAPHPLPDALPRPVPDHRSEPAPELAGELSGELARELRAMNRPKLLIRAARHGMASYDRRRDLKRLIPVSGLPSPVRALRALMQQEAALEALRANRGGRYTVTRHVELLIALMAEARTVLMPQAVLTPQNARRVAPCTRRTPHGPKDSPGN